MKEKRILVIDDESETRNLLKTIISHAGAEVITASDGTEGLGQIYKHKPDLIILDIMMPKMNGWQTLQIIRQVCATPIFVLTALSEDVENITRALDNGAIDYVSKPFNSKILISRIRAVLRQVEEAAKQKTQSIYYDDYLTIDLFKQEIFVGNQPVKLTKIEQKLFAFLFLNKGRVLTTDQILENVWGVDTPNLESSVHVYMSRLRKKIEKNPGCPQYLHTEHGVGYRGVFSGDM
jgi:DNA-binding response OmpR family regulator